MQRQPPAGGVEVGAGIYGEDPAQQAGGFLTGRFFAGEVVAEGQKLFECRFGAGHGALGGVVFVCWLLAHGYS